MANGNRGVNAGALSAKERGALVEQLRKIEPAED